MRTRILGLIVFVCTYFFVSAQGNVLTNSIWRNDITTNNVRPEKNRSINNSIPDINEQTIHNGSIAKVYTFNYTFSGHGTEAEPFLISTPEDLIAFSNAVNSKAKYGSGEDDYYYNAHFKLTADIDMSTRVQGPFVRCSEAIYAANPVNAYMRKQEHVIKATQSGSAYQCKAVIDDQGDENVTVASATSITTRTYNRGQVVFGLDFIVGHVGKGQIKANVTDTFSYSFYSPTTLPQSALMDPIGSYARYIRNAGTNNETMGDFTQLHTPFAGVFDGDNHTISNFEMVTSNNVAGLFGYLSGKDENHLAYVRNLRMNNCIFSGDNEYAGAIAGLIGWGKIENCYVTNSEINGQYAGGIAGGSTDGIKVKGGSVQLVDGVASDDIADGYIIGSTSEGNIIDGSTSAGGIIGSSPSPEDTTRLVDNQVGDNQVAGTSTGEIVPGLTGGDDGIQGNGNIVHKHESDGLSFKDYIKALLAGMVPDFCYINKGIVFDPSVERDANTLKHLEDQLKGAVPIDQNLVLPDTSKLNEFNLATQFDGLTDAEKIEKVCSKMYEEHIEYGNVKTCENCDCALTGLQSLLTTNVYRASLSGGDTIYTRVIGPRNYLETLFYHITGDEDVYYQYNIVVDPGNSSVLLDVRFTKKIYGETVVGTEGYEYIYKGWSCYDDAAKAPYIAEVEGIGLEKLMGLEDLSKYYKLTAPQPIVIDHVIGVGGIYDKGGQLNGKTVKLQRDLSLENWNLLGITKIESMGNGWNGSPMDKKVNFLSNTADNNDFAAVEFDYAINDWKSANASEKPDTLYMYSTDNLNYGQGIFVWPYNTIHPLTDEGNWDFSTTTYERPILYQAGQVKAYNDVDAEGNNVLDGTLEAYKHSLKNLGTPNTSGTGGSIVSAKWFSLANPFTAEVNVDTLIAHLKGTGYIQGDVLYKYNVDSYGNAQWKTSPTEKIYAGDAFLVGIPNEAGDTLNGMISTHSLVGYRYAPLLSSPIEPTEQDPSLGTKTKAKSSTKEEKMIFSCYDRTNIGVCRNMTASYTLEARNHFDRTDAYALLSTAEKYAVEPFFVVNDEKIWHNGFNRLPYDVPVGFNAVKPSEVRFSMAGEPDDMDVYLMDARTGEMISKLTLDTVIKFVEYDTISYYDTIIARGVVTLNLSQGYNLGKYKIRFCEKGSYVGITDVVTKTPTEADVTIWNNNRQVTIYGEDLKYVEVYNTMGQKVYGRELSGDTYKFDLKTISGAYIIRVRTSDASKTQKIVIR